MLMSSFSGWHLSQSQGPVDASMPQKPALTKIHAVTPEEYFLIIPQQSVRKIFLFGLYALGLLVALASSLEISSPAT